MNKKSFYRIIVNSILIATAEQGQIWIYYISHYLSFIKNIKLFSYLENYKPPF